MRFQEINIFIVLNILFISFSCSQDSATNTYSAIEHDITNPASHQYGIESIAAEYFQIQSALDSLENAVNRQDSLIAAKISAELGNRLRLAGLYPEGLNYYYQALKIIPAAQKKSYLSELRHGLAAVYYEMYVHDSTKYHFLDSAWINGTISLQLAKDEGKSRLISNALNLLGAILVNKGKPAEALEYLDRSIETARSEGRYFPEAEMNLVSAYLKLGKTEEARKLAFEALGRAEKENQKVLAGVFLEQLIKISRQTGNTDELKMLSERLQDLKSPRDELVRTLMIKQQLLNHKIKTEERITAGLYRERYYWITLSRILIISIVISLIIVASAVFLLTQNRKIRLKETELNEVRKKIDEAEKQAIKLQLENQNQALAAKMLSLAHSNELLTSMRERLREGLLKPDEAIRHELITIDRELEKNLDHKLWDDFELVYASGNSSFMKNLMQVHPNLSINEKRLCYLIVSGPGSKEISGVLGKNYRAVEMARHRLRQKLALDKEQGLEEYLLGFLEHNM